MSSPLPASDATLASDAAPVGSGEPAGGALSAHLDRLVEQTTPHLIGVRHHSPALAAAMPALLDAARPDVLAIELPTEAAAWIDWLTHPEAVAPLALGLGVRWPASGGGSGGGRDADCSGGSGGSGGGPRGDAGGGFYPFADFSPELAALRWARAHGVDVRCIDLPIAARVAAPATADQNIESDHDMPTPEPQRPASPCSLQSRPGRSIRMAESITRRCGTGWSKPPHQDLHRRTSAGQLCGTGGRCATTLKRAPGSTPTRWPARPICAPACRNCAAAASPL